MVHVKFDPSTVRYTDFELIQYGSGEYAYFQGGIPFQRGFGYYQNGAGIGDFLRSLWRMLLPSLKTAGRAVGKEALHTGSRILEKVGDGDNLKDTLRTEAVKGVENLILQKGNGKRKRSIKGIRKRKKIIYANHLPETKRKRSDAFGFY